MALLDNLGIYAGKIDTDNLALLRHKDRKRKGSEKRGIFSNGVSISERSEQANNRTEFGHWELDSMVSSRGESKGVFSTFIERKSRLYTVFVGKDRTADTMEQAICRLHKALPKGTFKSAASDRGKEFACHARAFPRNTKNYNFSRGKTFSKVFPLDPLSKRFNYLKYSEFHMEILYSKAK